jgi:hypothetical protein
MNAFGELLTNPSYTVFILSGIVYLIFGIGYITYKFGIKLLFKRMNIL